MAIFKCKICGGALEIDGAQSVATCEYCGTKQTLPRLDDERRANLYDRANHFRRNNDFDKAMGIYEGILNEDTTDAEAYWSILLCRYGIEYVKDPATKKRVPTVNRAQFTSIFDDEDYKSAIANADAHQRELYEAEAAAINELQKGILAISQKEEPFDVFICYKETDSNGRRTQDSVLATELYHELTREGFKVFFSRITLEDKLGVAYEPYIFAALHSAKVMVVLGTSPEYFNAVWVKNEWSRYLALIKNGAKKTLIPAYRDMDPYDLPEEFSHLQAQDMSKLGFMQDLLHGIKKMVEAGAPKSTARATAVSTAAPNIEPLLKRAFLFLEDGDFGRADDFCEQVLNQDPENAEAYLCKLMIEKGIKTKEELAFCNEDLENDSNYQKAVRFADAKLAALLEGYVISIKDRKAKEAEEARREALYLESLEKMQSEDITEFQEAAEAFAVLTGYKDSEECERFCREQIDLITKKQEQDRLERERLAEEKRIADEKRKIKLKQRAQKAKKIGAITAIVAVPVIAFVLIWTLLIIPYGKYRDALDLMSYERYEDAITAFKALDGFKDSEEKIKECNTLIRDKKYEHALALMSAGKYEAAISEFEALGGYRDSSTQILNAKIAILENNYQEGLKLYEKGDFQTAYYTFSRLATYKDSEAQATKCKTSITNLMQAHINAGDYVKFIEYANWLSGEFLNDLIFTDVQATQFYNYLVKDVRTISLSTFITDVSVNLKYFNLISNYQDAKNIVALRNIFGTVNNGDYIELFKNNMVEITSFWETDIIRKLLISDGCITYFLNGQWKATNATSLNYYINFYHKEGNNKNISTCTYNLPHADVDFAYWDVQNLEFVYLNDLQQTIAFVYKISFYDADTMIVYCYEDKETYLLGRHTEGLKLASYTISNDWFYEVTEYTGDHTEIFIPTSYSGTVIKRINSLAFENCTSITSVHMEEGMEVIRSNAFKGCTSLKSIVLPNSVTLICSNAFSGCSNLTTIVYDGTIAQWNAIQKDAGWNNLCAADCVIQCLDGVVKK